MTLAAVAEVIDNSVALCHELVVKRQLQLTHDEKLINDVSKSSNEFTAGDFQKVLFHSFIRRSSWQTGRY